MKKTILLIIALILCILLAVNLCAQSTVSIVLQPTDRGLGIKFDRQQGNIGVYTAITSGSYDNPCGIIIKEHFKTSLGLMIHLPKYGSFVSIGGNYNLYSGYDSDIHVSNRVFMPVSLELGCGWRLGRITPALRMDVLKWESSIDIGFMF